MSDGYTGLIGTIVGALITGGFAWFSDWRKNRAKNQKDLEVLALKLSYKLELYVAQCLECSEDDGLEYYVEDDGRGSGTYFRGYTTEFPEFTLGKFEDIEWKLLPVSLMHEIFTLPTKVNNAKQRFNKEWKDFDNHLNDSYPTTIRAKELTDLGIYFYNVSSKLRTLVGLPLPDDLSIINKLKKNKIENDKEYYKLFV
ncbi:hypothetical protein [Klebsiella grimontii]|uniref:hypothetical protein n=1 Tax=Klebsiella grimontii TaxID=2058152 RepID=UPI0006685903|nr:hypothetical protein [Klebsiella grimontii]MDH0811724.1 hypothetical protein [Klebsiella grimontii]MDH2042092.1 hypothetical protein [Klebsiella grimontii]GJK92525.1 hypothetical protein TUM17568_37310 [Klebsiella oxytoca]GJK98455.1 hypothetical protein TUM17569_39160 [Klebsiella oxytoca]